MQTIYKISGIAILFIIIGFVLTYPYELSFKGSEEIILLEDSYEFSSLSEIISRDEFKNKVLYVDLSEPWDPWPSSKDEMQEKYLALLALINRYKDKDVAFIYLIRPDSDTGQKDDYRKWKAIVKTLYKTRGYHILMSPGLFKNILNDIPEIRENHFLPHYLIVDKTGTMVNLNAPPPNNREMLYFELDSLLKQ